MTTIRNIPKIDALTAQDMIPIWDYETSTTKAIEFAKLVESIQAIPHPDDGIDEQAVLKILADWFKDHPAITTSDVKQAIDTAIDALPVILTRDDVSDEVSLRLKLLGWSESPLTLSNINDAIATYIADNQIGANLLTRDDVETITVNYLRTSGDGVINAWIEKYLVDHPFPHVPTQADIETIIYNYLADHPVSGGEGSGADPATIQAAIATYFQANPIKVGDGLTTSGVKTIISDYLTANPQPGQFDEQDINEFIRQWVASHPDAYTSGFTQTQVETIIKNYLAANPDKIVLPNTVMQSTIDWAGTGVDLNSANWINRTFYAAKNATNYPADVLPTQSGAVISDCAWYDQNQMQGRVQYAVNSDGFAYRTKGAGDNGTWSTWGYVDFKGAGGVSDADIEQAVNTYLSVRPPSGAMRMASSWAALKILTPTGEGERVYLRSYTPGNTFGGGYFVGSLKPKADDKGFTCSNGGSYFWQRELQIDQLDVTHFGAVPDGSTDAHDAIMAMFDFLKSSAANAINDLADSMPIKFAPGEYYTTPCDFATAGRLMTNTEILDAQRREAWRRLAMNTGTNKLTNPNGAEVTRWQDVDPTLGARNSEQENPNDHMAINNIGFVSKIIVPYGRVPQVRITSNKQNDSFVFLFNSRLTQIHGLSLDGQITQRVAWGGNGPSDKSTSPSNSQGFFKNYCSGGQYWNVSSVQAKYVGGKTFVVKDSLDSKFEQIYSSMCWDSVLYSGWTNAVVGNWNHATALELCNCNFQSQMGPNMPPVYMPRMGQALIRNVWIEHSLCPLDITDWQGTIDTLCIESSLYPVHAYGARFILQCWSAPTGVDFDTTTPPYITKDGVEIDNPDWYSHRLYPDGTKVKVLGGSGYEKGSIMMQSYGVDLNGVMRANVYQSGRTCNPFETERWVKIGTMLGISAEKGLITRLLQQGGGDLSQVNSLVTDMRNGAQAELRLYSSRLQAAGVVDNKNPQQPGSPGVTVIRCNMWGGGGASPGVTWHNEGDPAVLDIAVSGYLSQITFWAKLPPKTKELGYMMVCTGVTRFNAGPSSNWTDARGFSLPTTSNPPGEYDFKIPQQRWAVSTKKAGLGLTNDGRLNIQTIAPSKVPTNLTPVGYVSAYIGGVERAIPYYEIPS